MPVERASGEGGAQVLAPGGRDASKPQAGVGGRDVQVGAARHDDRLAADVERMVTPAPRPHRRQGFVEQAMEQLPVDVGGGVGNLELSGSGGGGGHAGLPANVRSSAAWNSVTSSSICSSVTTNGGAIITRSPFSPSP